MEYESDEDVSDTESVGSDEVAKLLTEAADLADMETEEVCGAWRVVCEEFGFCSRAWMSNVQACFDEAEGCRTRIAMILPFSLSKKEKRRNNQCPGPNIQGFPTIALIGRSMLGQFPVRRKI